MFKSVEDEVIPPNTDLSLLGACTKDASHLFLIVCGQPRYSPYGWLDWGMDKVMLFTLSGGAAHTATLLINKTSIRMEGIDI